MQNIPKMTPELFQKLLESVKPVWVNGLLPKAPGVSVEERSDAPVVPSEFIHGNFNEMDVTWFSLSPLYCALGRNFNLLEDFSRTLEGKYACAATFKTDFPLFSRLDSDLCNVISCIDKDHFQYLRMFLAESGFTLNKKWWLLHEANFNLRQPGAETSFSLTVYTPVSVDVGIYPFHDMMSGTVGFYQGVGNQLVEQYAQVYNANAKGRS